MLILFLIVFIDLIGFGIVNRVCARTSSARGQKGARG